MPQGGTFHKWGFCMPIYEYECCLCHLHFEQRQHFHEAAISYCPECQGEARRVIHPVPVFYKGSGFYTTDHSRGANTSSPSSSPSSNLSNDPSSSKKSNGEGEAGAVTEDG